MLIRMEQSRARAAVIMPTSLFRMDKELIIVSFRMTVSLALYIPSSLRLRVILNREGKAGEPPSVVLVGFHTPSSLSKESWTYAG